MKVTLSKNLSYCHGIKLAIEKTLEFIESYPGEKIYMLGDIAHNNNVSDLLKEKGLSIVDDIDDIENNTTVIIRAHGTTPSVLAEAKRKGLRVLDMTCPFVKKMVNDALGFENRGYFVVIIGDKNHDEIVSITSHLKYKMVIQNMEEIKQNEHLFKKKIYLMLQSTTIWEHAEPLVKLIECYADELVFHKSICAPTRNRQKEARELAKTNDLVLVIGSHTSSNTYNLYKICLDINPNSLLVENVKALPDHVHDYKSIALISGASTPDFIIEEIVSAFS